MKADKINRELAKRLQRLIQKADALIASIECVTDQFEPEVAGPLRCRQLGGKNPRQD
jgi:hypothetical protein